MHRTTNEEVGFCDFIIVFHYSLVNNSLKIMAIQITKLFYPVIFYKGWGRPTGTLSSYSYCLIVSVFVIIIIMSHHSHLIH